MPGHPSGGAAAVVVAQAVLRPHEEVVVRAHHRGDGAAGVAEAEGIVRVHPGRRGHRGCGGRFWCFLFATGGECSTDNEQVGVAEHGGNILDRTGRYSVVRPGLDPGSVVRRVGRLPSGARLTAVRLACFASALFHLSRTPLAAFTHCPVYLRIQWRSVVGFRKPPARLACSAETMAAIAMDAAPAYTFSVRRPNALGSGAQQRLGIERSSCSLLTYLCM